MGVNEFFTVIPDICGSLVQNLLQGSLWHLQFYVAPGFLGNLCTPNLCPLLSYGVFM